ARRLWVVLESFARTRSSAFRDRGPRGLSDPSLDRRRRAGLWAGSPLSGRRREAEADSDDGGLSGALRLHPAARDQSLWRPQALERPADAGDDGALLSQRQQIPAVAALFARDARPRADPA